MNHTLFALLDKLDAAKIHYTLARHRSDSVLVAVTIVGQRIEIDVFRDGHMEISRFVGHEDIEGGAELIDSIVELGRRARPSAPSGTTGTDTKNPGKPLICRGF